MNPALNQLRDIHLPPPISAWPPAPGWWLLLLLVLALALGGYFWRRRTHLRWRQQARAELSRLRQLYAAQQSSPAMLAGALSVLLRRVAISRFPPQEVAALNGEAWLAFLDRTLGQQGVFQSDPGRMLTSAPYLPDAQIDRTMLPDLFSRVERWVDRVSAPGKP